MVIHKSLQDFRTLQYNGYDGDGEGHVNRGRDIPSFCRTLQVLDRSTLGDVADVNPLIKFMRTARSRAATASTILCHSCGTSHDIGSMYTWSSM